MKSTSNKMPNVAVFGLAVMGSSLARNIASRGYPTLIYNRSADVTKSFLEKYDSPQFIAAYSLSELAQKMARPRQIILMIKAGDAVDRVIEELLPVLDQGDIILDGGNAFYKDTQRREKLAKDSGIHFLGVGISGGEEGALKGPSIMPGGSYAAWQIVSPLLSAIAAKIGNEPCTDYVGPDGAGHFVKMVHNGIEYADMQLIADVYQLLKSGIGLDNKEISNCFSEWNNGRLSSYLMEITGKILITKDSDGSQEEYLVDKILDKAEQKGTGRWTLQEALELGVSVPTIAAAVDARVLSSYKETRVEAESIYRLERANTSLKFAEYFKSDPEKIKNALEHTLYFAKVISYAQGLHLIYEASKQYNWNLKLDRVASLWRAGCIIRAKLLENIMIAYKDKPELINLIFSPYFVNELKEAVKSAREVVTASAASGIPIPALSSALNYFELITSGRIQLNLIQAQRDFFGAHTYERVDREGKFHTEW